MQERQINKTLKNKQGPQTGNAARVQFPAVNQFKEQSKTPGLLDPGAQSGQDTPGKNKTVQGVFGIWGIHLENEDTEYKRILLYGSADFSDALAYVQHVLKHCKKDNINDTNIDIIATEIRTQKQLENAYGKEKVTQNISLLESLGVNVYFEIDATNHAYLGPFDEISFRNPHSGVYGNDYDQSGLSHLESISSNHQLFDKTMRSALKHIAPYGKLMISVSGFPYINEKTVYHLKGLNLENAERAIEYGQRNGWEFVRYHKFEETTKRRNNGGTFKSREVVLEYRENHKWKDAEVVEQFMRALPENKWFSWMRKHPKFDSLYEMLTQEGEIYQMDESLYTNQQPVIEVELGDKMNEEL